ncbi:dihydrolipoyl dehydrogenase [Candidatus Thorarchaeota archaeon]|nr:MAG: dihydrolipoyl dehydrogenase [Candidatus Thorarchaeota archaeon]
MLILIKISLLFNPHNLSSSTYKLINNSELVNNMKDYDLIVIGSGAGMNVASAAYERGMKVAIVEHGPMGGTCLNRGCIPTKILTYLADIIVQAEHLKSLGVKMKIESIDYPSIMKRMRSEVDGSSKSQGESVDAAEGIDWYKGTGSFVDDYTIEIKGEKIKSNTILIAAGSRPVVPNIKGLDTVEYLLNDDALHLMEQPKSMVIVGGGYIAAEFGHFFAAVGTEVTIIGRNQYLVKNEDPDISEILKKQLSKRMNVHTNQEVVEVKEEDGMKVVIARNRDTEEETEYKGEVLLIASGRRSNADLFKPENTGVKTDERGWVIVDEYFRTSKKGIWAFGDAIGKYQFRHVANDESQIVWFNMSKVLDNDKEREFLTMDYHAVPRAVFSYPPIASVGMNMKEAQESGLKLYVGEADYSVAAKGFAMGNPPSKIRVIVDAESKRILGASIIGPYSPILIQEIINLMYTRDGTYYPMFQAMHIHPALSEVVQRAFGRMTPVGEHEHHH